MTKPLDPYPFRLRGTYDPFASRWAVTQYHEPGELLFDPRPEYEQDRSKY